MNVDYHFKTNSSVATMWGNGIGVAPNNLLRTTNSAALLDDKASFLWEICSSDQVQVLCVARFITPKFYQPNEMNDMDDWGFPLDENSTGWSDKMLLAEQRDNRKGGFIPAYHGPDAVATFKHAPSSSVQWHASDENTAVSWLDEMFPDAENESLYKNDLGIISSQPSDAEAAFFKNTSAWGKPSNESSAQAWLHSLLPSITDHECILVPKANVLRSSIKSEEFACGATWVTQTISSGSSTDGEDVEVPPMVLVMPIVEDDIVSVIDEDDPLMEDNGFSPPATISFQNLDDSASVVSSITDEESVMTENSGMYSFIGSDYSPNTIGYVD